MIMEELLAVAADAWHIFGSAFTPRHQGLGERGHQTMLQQHSILMHAYTRSWPQEWSWLVVVVQFLYWTMAQSSVGLSARDMTMGYAIAQDTHRLMLPFRIPKGLAQTDLCARMFDNFRNLYLSLIHI